MLREAIEYLVEHGRGARRPEFIIRPGDPPGVVHLIEADGSRFSSASDGTMIHRRRQRPGRIPARTADTK